VQKIKFKSFVLIIPILIFSLAAYVRALPAVKIVNVVCFKKCRREYLFFNIIRKI